MTFTYPLPQDTRQKFSNRNHQCSNLSLLLDRYIGYKSERRPWQFQEEQKIDFFKAIARHFQFPPDLIQANYQRWRAIIKTLPFAERYAFTASPEWRMVVGLGQTSILETSMTLNRITGIPVIPGSALKGLAASYALLCILKKTNRVDEVEQVYKQYQQQEIDVLPEHYNDFIGIFGSQGEAGKVIFLDAVPTQPPTLEPDIMNNHYPDYYGKDKPPTPYQNPNPVYFLTLGKKSQFAFAVAGREPNERTEQLVNIATEWLCQGLSELGIGAKTAAGYGYLISDI